LVRTRRLLIPALLLAHAGLLMVVWRERPAAATPSAAIVTVTEIAAPAPPSLAAEVKLQPVTAAVDAPELTAADIAEPAAALAGLAPGAAGCDLSDAVLARLHGSPAVTAAIERIPRAARSVADAVLLWDGHWIDAGAVGGSDALEPIRIAVVSAVRAAPAPCRDASVTGPRLLIVAGTDGNRVLAFGSGQWTWAQVIGG
jgi:hypothetical protein